MSSSTSPTTATKPAAKPAGNTATTTPATSSNVSQGMSGMNTGDTKPQVWKPPSGKQEYVVQEDLSGAPDWIDRAWFGVGCIKVPVGDWPFGQPYTTKRAVPGDQVQYVPPSANQGAHLIVVENVEPQARKEIVKPAQASAVSTEDQLKTGNLKVEDLSTAHKIGLVAMSPKLRPLVEGGVQLPEAPDLPVAAKSP